MENRKSTGEVLRELGMSDRADFYGLGRHVCSDMSGEILMNIYKGIKTGIGEKEAEVFKQMVFDLPTVKALVLVDMLHNLQIEGIKDGWWWNKEIYLKCYSNHFIPNLLDMPVCRDSEQMKEEFKVLLNE